MQTISAAAKRAFDEGLSLTALPRVIVDWNQNRFAPSVTASVDDPGQEVTDKVEDKKYPIESIAWNNRPLAGLPKARIGEAKTSGKYRTVSKGAAYKYWSSSTQSSATGSTGNYPITGTNPTVIYGASVKVNKIVIKTENTWAGPNQLQVQTTTDGNTWATVWATPNVNADGSLTLYLQSNGTWGVTVHRDNSTLIRGIRFNVTSMTHPNAHLGVIEVSGRFERDISSDVISVDVSKSLADADIATPVGTISSNRATIELDTTNRNYDVEYIASPYYGLLHANAEVSVWLGVDTTAFGGSGIEYIRQGTFWSDTWQIDGPAAVVTLETTDGSKFLQDDRVLPSLFIGKTAPEIIAEILRRAGISRFNIPTDSTEPVIPYVWFSREDTVWSAIQSVCRATQGVVFFDENGLPTYLSKNSLYSKLSGAADYGLTAITEAPKQPNIIDLEHEYDTEINKVVVTYSPRIQNTKEVRVTRKTPTGGNTPTYFDAEGEKYDATYSYDKTPINSVLWSPEGTVALQAARLAKNATANDTSIWIPEDAARTWPFIGKVNIEGEIISYTGKMYKSFKNNAPVYSNITSIEQQKGIDAESDLTTRGQNRYTGELKNCLRGRDGSTPKEHTINITGWSHYLKQSDETVRTDNTHTRQEQSSLVLMGPNLNGTYESYLMSSRGSLNDSYTAYGCRMRFANIQSAHATAGIFFHQQSDRMSGYYVEFNTTRMATQILKGNVANVRVYKMLSDGSRRHLPNDSTGMRGKDYNIVPGQWFNVDVTQAKQQNRFILYVNGQVYASWIDTWGGAWTQGNWGVFTRGHSGALWEYFYVNNEVIPPKIDESAFIHKKTGAFTSGYADMEVNRSNAKKVNWFFDEFGPYVHEIREFDVEYDKWPAIRPFLYKSNDWDAYTTDMTFTPFSAKFTIANAGRDLAVLNGEDTSVAFGQVVNQQMMLYGQLVIEEQTKQHVVKNEPAIRKRGEVVLEVESKWIQTEAHAKDYGTFITQHWGEPADNISVSVFINPAVQVGDLVTVNWPERSFSHNTHKYFVNSINLGYDKGIHGTLTLRRAR